MANNEVSGIVVATAIARWLQCQSNLHYSYRIVSVQRQSDLLHLFQEIITR